MSFGFFLQEALRSLARTRAPALAAALTVLLTTLVLGVFIPVVQATTGTANEVRGRIVVDVYLEDGISAADREQVRRAIERIGNVKSVTYISKDEALRIAERRNPQAFREGVKLLGRNPLPASFRIVPRDPGRVGEIIDRLAPRDQRGVRRPDLPGIQEVRNREDDTERILTATSVVKAATGVLAALLAFAAVALIANTIRLSIFARRREVEVMRLVGATNWSIRWPFVIEGVIVGLVGALGAVALLYVTKQAVLDPLAERFALIAAPQTIPFPALAAVLLLAAAAVSAAGSALTLRRFLRV